MAVTRLRNTVVPHLHRNNTRSGGIVHSMIPAVSVADAALLVVVVIAPLVAAEQPLAPRGKPPTRLNSLAVRHPSLDSSIDVVAKLENDYRT